MSNFQASFLNNWRRYSQLVWPQYCQLCAARTHAAPVCGACYLRLPWLTRIRCPQCAMPTPSGEICGACLSHPPLFDEVRAAFSYGWPLSRLVQNYKYGGNLALARLLGRALAARGGTLRADLVIPMPLAPARLRERGFNQAVEIAREVSRQSGVPLVSTACRRVRDCTPQAALPWTERKRNIRNAFVCDANLSGLRVAVIDDVMTTGTTLNELARNLRKAGAAHIQGWMVARTLKSGTQPPQ